MAQRSVRQLREDVTTRLLTLSGWRQSIVAPSDFGRDPGTLLGSKCFAVNPGTTTDLRQYRQRPAEGTLVETMLQIRWAHQLKPTSMSTSYDDALDSEAALTNAMMVYDSSWPASYKMQYVSATRETSLSGEWVLGTIEFRVVHTLPLQ
jgi:hypothetical protein